MMIGLPTGGRVRAMESNQEPMRVLIVDDEPSNVLLLQAILKGEPGLDITATTDSREALGLVEETRPDLILLDLRMPHLDGFEVLDQLTPHQIGNYLPVLVLTADATAETMRRALAVGATDFLTKPLDPIEVLLRIRNLLHTRELYSQIREHNELLEQRVRERTKDLELAGLEILDRLARTTEFRDDTTGEHERRVGEHAARVWRVLGLDPEREEVIRLAAPLHDVGKIGVPDSILLKEARLTTEEFETVKTHTTIGAEILAGSRFSVLQMGERIARWHHERWDGSGYPDGLSGDEIPIEARIVEVCDIFDALVNDRPYKTAWSWEDALSELRRSAGSQLDAQVVDAFCRLVESGEIRP